MKNPMRMLHQLDYLKRHQHTIIRHLNPKRIRNIILNQSEMRTKKTILRSNPVFLKIEPTALCQLRCPGCDPEIQRGLRQPNAKMSYQDFLKIIEPVADTTVLASLSFRGDSLLNPDLFDMINFCHEYNIGTEFPTNFNYVFNNNQIERLVDAGLDHIIVALDGTTQEAYEQYRRGGRLELVLNNCRELIAAKRRKRSSTPVVEWKFIVFQHNKHQYDDAKRMAHEMGFDRFSSVLDYFDPQRKDEEKIPETLRNSGKKVCYWPYRTAVISWSGDVVPCCYFWRYNMGNAIKDGLQAVWNGPEYQEIREMFTTGVPPTNKRTRCEDCNLFWGAKTPTDIGPMG